MRGLRIRYTISKAYVAEFDRSIDDPGHAALVLVQLRLGVDQFQDAPRAGDAELSQLEGEDGHERGEAQEADQADVADDLPQRQVAGAPEQHGVEKGQSPANAEDQHGQIAGLNLALAHGVVAVDAGVVGELGTLLLLLSVALHDLDTADRLGQPGVHNAERLAHPLADRAEAPGVAANGDDEQDQEDDRRQ